MWDLPADMKGPICRKLEEQFDFLFKQLGVPNTEHLVKKFIQPAAVDVPAPASAARVLG
jgi:hypothetical protein